MNETNAIKHFDVHTTDYHPMPEFGGSQAVLYQSVDGKRIAGSFKESGRHTLTMAYDEFLYVITGSATISIHGGERYEVSAGGACYLREGSIVDFEMSPDFHDVAVLISDREISY